MKFILAITALLAAQTFAVFDNRCKVSQRQPAASNKQCIPYTDSTGTVWNTCIPFSTLSPQNPPTNVVGKQWCSTSAAFDIASTDPNINGLWGVCQGLPNACLFVPVTSSPTKRPSASPTVKTKRPSASPTAKATKRPTSSRPSKNPTAKPTKTPTKAPVCSGSGKNSCAPTSPPVPSAEPTSAPSEYEVEPTEAPTEEEFTEAPTPEETAAPSTATPAPVEQTSAPTLATAAPTATKAPTTKAPTQTGATLAPTAATTSAPVTSAPTQPLPTSPPSNAATLAPSPPILPPTVSPTFGGSSVAQAGTVFVAVIVLAVAQIMA